MKPATSIDHPEHGRRYDVCNGDADGLCAVRQWRLHEPAPATLITGLKREIDLLARVPTDAADEVLVCDLSMQRNRAALKRLLAAGVHVHYFDHHAVGAVVPVHAGFNAHVEESSAVCTSLLMDRHLHGRFRAWALVGAYGDNLTRLADELATKSGFDADERRRLRRLGEAINYNAYGDSLADVCLAPASMYALLCRHEQPLDLLTHEPVFEIIERQRADDLRRASAVAPLRRDEAACVTVLPDAAWSRRVIGSLANVLVNAQPRQAQAVLKSRADGGFVVSVRAPLHEPAGPAQGRIPEGAARRYTGAPAGPPQGRTPEGAARRYTGEPVGAGEFCARFGGAGRAGAAGIDQLPARELDDFVDAFFAAWPALLLSR